MQVDERQSRKSIGLKSASFRSSEDDYETTDAESEDHEDQPEI